MSALLNDLDHGDESKNAPKTLRHARQGSSQPGYRTAAILLKADLALSHNDGAAAARGYRSVIDDDDLPKPYRDAALVRLDRGAIRYDAAGTGDREAQAARRAG